MISATDRKQVLSLIEIAKNSGARETLACKEIGISQRTVQRWRSEDTPNEDQRPTAERPEPKNKLTQQEVDKVLKVVNSPEFQSRPPSQIVPTLADQGEYIASESTMYRILREHNMQHHRGRSKKPSSKPISTHCATGPNQVWMWDITWLPGPAKGIYFYLYLILDLFSRKIVAWEIFPEESALFASQLVRKAALSESLSAAHKPLVLHSDNGSPMKGASLLETLYMLGIKPSRSRPRVSNDNPYAESIFRTCKYRPDYPASGFSTISESREWVQPFAHWYNFEHKHSGINFVTPHQRHSGAAEGVLEHRQAVYEQARSANPQRWSRNIRDWSLPKEVWLNPERTVEKPTQAKPA